ncbi:MAG: phosphoglycolate phosphatase [Robiginitomaculum sp.]|nr:MAG: phosphoglycolate phosphatase [Robiginitomaculum sp.]
MASRLNAVSLSFDLDGTLVDTAPDLIRVLNEVIAEDGLTPIPVEKARHLIGYGSMALIKKAYEGTDTALSEPRALVLQKQFLGLYAQDLSRLSRPYPGVVEVLAELKRAGAHLSVCTNKPGAMARPLLQQLGLSGFFDRVVGANDTKLCKPAAQHIFDAVGHRGTKPIVMIGDGAPDVYAARAAKIPVILMSYGYCPVSVHTFGADVVLRSFRELPSALKIILGTQPKD